MGKSSIDAAGAAKKSNTPKRARGTTLSLFCPSVAGSFLFRDFDIRSIDLCPSSSSSSLSVCFCNRNGNNIRYEMFAARDARDAFDADADAFVAFTLARNAFFLHLVSHPDRCVVGIR